MKVVFSWIAAFIIVGVVQIHFSTCKRRQGPDSFRYIYEATTTNAPEKIQYSSNITVVKQPGPGPEPKPKPEPGAEPVPASALKNMKR